MSRKIRIDEDLKNQPLAEHQQDLVDEPELRAPSPAMKGAAMGGEPAPVGSGKAPFGGKQAPPFTGGRAKKRKIQVGKHQVHGGRRRGPID